jgi:hypothetical protein
MNLASALANGAWLAASIPAWRRFQRALRHPEETQQHLLRSLLSNNSECAYGRAHGFGDIRSYEQFRERAPLATYEDLAPWIARIMRGEKRVLTQAPVTRLLPTSGSTGGRKFIPITAGFQNELNDAIGPWMIDLSRQHPSLRLGPAYWSISPAIHIADIESAVPVNFDDDSAYLGGVRQRLAAATFAVPGELRLVNDIETCRYLTLLCLLRAPELRLISVWHPSFLALLLDTLESSWNELLDDVERGGCRQASALPCEVRRVMAAAAQPRRATELLRHGPEDLGTIWPRLRSVSCWGDGHATLPLAQLQKRMPGVAFQSKGLLATEAFVSIPFQNRHPIAVRSHFFEFIDSRGKVRQAHELRVGESYEVVVTTAGGLWRYQLRDLVEVDGFVDATPSLRFLGRGKSVSDLCGEKLAEHFVTQAIDTACASFQFVPQFAMLAPEATAEGRWRYTLFVEGDSPPALPTRLDDALRRNPHYALCRDLRQLEAVGCHRVNHGAYEVFCRLHASEGRRFGDIKPQALSTRTDWRALFDGRESSA